MRISANNSATVRPQINVRQPYLWPCERSGGARWLRPPPSHLPPLATPAWRAGARAPPGPGQVAPGGFGPSKPPARPPSPHTHLLSPGCQAVRCCQVICRAVGQLSGTVRCLCQTSCQVLSVLSGAVGCVSDRRGGSVAVGCCRSCRVLLSDAIGAVRAVRLLLLSDVGLLLSGAVRWCCRAALAVGVLSGSDTHQPHL